MPFREHDLVVLTCGVAGLRAGVRGAVVGVYGSGGYEVEVVDGDGVTVAVVTVEEADIMAV